MNDFSSPYYKALLKALDVAADSVVAHAWGRDYTLAQLEAMSDRERRLTNWKIRSYNWVLRFDLFRAKCQVWLWRTIDNLIP